MTAACLKIFTFDWRLVGSPYEVCAALGKGGGALRRGALALL